MPDARSPRRRLSAHERRARILDAAQEVFALRGYHGASLDEIAQASGSSKALIYEHFESKKALHESLLEEHAAVLFERFRANAARGTTGEERLRGGVDAFFSWVEEHRGPYRALFRDAADPELAPLVDRLQAQATRAIAALVHDDPDAGSEHADQATEMFAQLTTGACQALANWWGEHPEVPRAELVQRVVDFCWTGMERARAR